MLMQHIFIDQILFSSCAGPIKKGAQTVSEQMLMLKISTSLGLFFFHPGTFIWIIPVTALGQKDEQEQLISVTFIKYSPTQH